MSQLPAARAAQRVLDMEARGASGFETKGCLSKRSYLTRRGAKLSAKQMRGEGRSKLSCYRCAHCGLFHLTKVENNHRKRGAP